VTSVTPTILSTSPYVLRCMTILTKSVLIGIDSNQLSFEVAVTAVSI